MNFETSLLSLFHDSFFLRLSRTLALDAMLFQHVSLKSTRSNESSLFVGSVDEIDGGWFLRTHISSFFLTPEGVWWRIVQEANKCNGSKLVVVKMILKAVIFLRCDGES